MDFFDEIPIHKQNTLEQLLGRFQTVRDGLPELLKNAKDQYARLGITERAERPIVVIVDTERKRIGVLDFAGATRSDFTLWWEWSNPLANRAEVAPDIEGGHGNGGKAFMVQGSVEDSFFESVRDGRRTKMGYENRTEEHRFRPAFFEERGKRVDDQNVSSPRSKLDSVLEGLSVTFTALPDAARAAFERRQAFTIVQVNGIRDWSGRRATVEQLARGIPDDVMTHPQAALSVESCSIFFVLNGTLTSPAPLERSYPEPRPGFEEPVVIPIPEALVDPRTNEMVATGANSPTAHHLVLRTSKPSLRLANYKPFNVIRVRNARNIVANWSVADLYSRAESGFIFGELVVSSLGREHNLGADRVGLADTPLVRALNYWTAEQVAELAGRIQKSIARENKPEERDRANEGLQKMRDLMREFLDNEGPGEFSGLNDGNGDQGRDANSEKTPTRPRRFASTTRQIVLESGASEIALALGTQVPILVRAYGRDDRSGEKLPVRNPRLELVTASENIISAVAPRIVRGDAVGRTKFWYRDRDTGVESNRVEVEVVAATGVTIGGIPSRPLLQGQEVDLSVVFQTSAGPRQDLLLDAEVDEPLMGRIDRVGSFTAGYHEGTATVRVAFGASAGQAAELIVGSDRVPPRPKKVGAEGGDIPLILLCGTEAPNMEQYAPDLRTHPAAEQYPTIIDYEPVFQNAHVIFINHQSVEAMQVRRGRGGRKGTAGIGSETFLQFLAMKCFEVLKRLYVWKTLGDGATTAPQYREAFAGAETTCAPFIDRAYGLARELTASLKDVE